MANGDLSPPTIGRLREMGGEGFFAICVNANWRHSAALRFEALAVGDEVFFPENIRRRGFICSRCGGRVASLTPDWRGMRAPGMGPG